MDRFQLILPRNDHEAAAALSRGGVAKAGGIDLFDRMKEGISAPQWIVSLGYGEPWIGSPDFASAEYVELSAAATLAMIAEHADYRRLFPALARAAADAATPQIRNRATLGGNLLQEPRCWYYRLSDFTCWRKGREGCPAIEGDNRYHAILGQGKCPAVHASNLAPALVALGARVAIYGREDTPPVESLWPAPGSDGPFNTLERGEILRKVLLPEPGPNAYVEVRHRQSFDWALASAAVARTKAGAWRVVLGAVAPVPWRAKEAEFVLADEARPDADRIAKAAGAAVDGVRALSKNAYKVKLARVALQRALTEAAGGR